MSLTKTALLAIVASASFYAVLCYTLGIPGQPSITLNVEVERDGWLSFEDLDLPHKTEALPPLLDLVSVDPQFTYSLPGNSNLYGLNACADFEVLPVSDRKVFVLDAAERKGLDPLNPCLRQHAERAGTIVVDQCQAGDSLGEAFNRATGYFKTECDPGVPQWDLEPATSHTEFLEEWF